MSLSSFLDILRHQSYQFIHQPHVKATLLEFDFNSVEESLEPILEAVLYELDIDYSNYPNLCEIRDSVSDDIVYNDRNTFIINTFNLKRSRKKLLSLFINSLKSEVSTILDNLPYDYYFKVVDPELYDESISIIYFNPYREFYYSLSLSVRKVQTSKFREIPSFICTSKDLQELERQFDRIIKEGMIISDTYIYDDSEGVILVLSLAFDKGVKLGNIIITSSRKNTIKEILITASTISLEFYKFVCDIIVKLNTNHSTIFFDELHLDSVKKSV